MKISTKEIENKIAKATSWNDMKTIIKDLPRTTLRQRVEELCEKYNKNMRITAERAEIPASTFYAILNGDRPARKGQLVKFAFALGISLEELNELLKLAKLKELYAKNKEDAIIIFGIKQGLEIDEVEALLAEAGTSLQ